MKIKKNMKTNKKNGLTLLETLVVVTISIAILMSLVFWYQNYEKMQTAKAFGNDIAVVVNGVDRRTFVDGYDFDLWNKKEWTNTDEFVGDFLKKDMIAKLNTCGSGDGWNPQLEKESKTQLVSCDMWDKKLPMNLSVKGKIEEDGEGFLKRFYSVYYFQNSDDFDKNFPYFKRAILEAKRTNYSNITGSHSFDLVKVNDPNTEISSIQCLQEKTNCGIRASFDRSGGYEYLRVDGTNSMINSHVTFKTDKGSDKLLCSRWRQNETTKQWIYEKVDCGIGVQNQDGFKKGVDVLVDYSTQEMVLLDRQCNVYKKDSNNQLVQTGDLVPCGFSKDEFGGAKIYQYSQETIADEGYFYNLVGQNLYINAEAIISGDLTVKGNAEFEKDVNIAGNTKVSGTFTGESNGEIFGELKVHDKITGKYLVPETVVTKGSSCPAGSLGFIAKSSNGESVSCVNKSGVYTWQGGTDVATFSGLGNLGTWDMCSIIEIGNLEDSHYCRITKNANGTWSMSYYKSGCRAACIKI